MDGRMDGWTDGWTDGWMDGRISHAARRVRGATGSYDAIDGLAQLVNGESYLARSVKSEGCGRQLRRY